MELRLITEVRTPSQVFVLDATYFTDDTFARADILVKIHGGVILYYFLPCEDPQLAKALGGRGASTPLLGIPHGRFYAKRSNQGESSGWGGRAGEERNGGGGDGNQGIGGGVGGGGQRDERRGNRGRNHGGGNGDDDGNDRGGWVVDIEGEIRPIGRRPNRMPEILLLLNAEIIGTLEFLDISSLSARARIFRVVSLGFTSVAFICLSASIRQRGTNPMLASTLSWIGAAATFVGFILMLVMSLAATFIP